MSKLVSDLEAVMVVRFKLPPGTTAEQAGKMLSHGGVNIPLGLVNYIRYHTVAIVGIDEPYQDVPPTDFTGPKLQ